MFLRARQLKASTGTSLALVAMTVVGSLLCLSSPILAQDSTPPSETTSGTTVAQDASPENASSRPRSSVVDKEMPMPVQTKGLDIEEKLGNSLPMEAQFTTSEGKLIRLGDYFKDNKPAIIAMVYYKCPVVCDIVMQKLIDSVNDVDFEPGKDYNVLFFSFDSSETVEFAAQSKQGHMSNLVDRLQTPAAKAGFHFHIGDVTNSRQLAEAIGFKYRRLANGQFSHPSAIYITTPDGKISRYYYGFDYPSRDVKLSLIDATNGKLVRTIGDRIMSFCYMFDPNVGRYSIAAMRVMQVSGVISLFGVSALVGTLFVFERVRRRLWLTEQVSNAPASNVQEAQGIGPGSDVPTSTSERVPAGGGGLS